MSSGTKPKKEVDVPRPSARYFSPSPPPSTPHTSITTPFSILLISPTNEILLLHRVRTSSSFPSAHVFPGGNLSPSQDGSLPAPSSPDRHIDGPAYRLGAIRECFEESGILLAKKNDGSGALLEVEEGVREKARKDIHAGKLKFVDWVGEMGGVVDSGNYPKKIILLGLFILSLLFGGQC
jgi:8-oxo-dGTP pyrophosphatase MutT (NUDIX family)